MIVTQLHHKIENKPLVSNYKFQINPNMKFFSTNNPKLDLELKVLES
jgi:hypothetical protein